MGRRRGAPEIAGAGTPLAGLPVAVKDLFCTAGIPSQAGSRILAGYRPPYTATVVARLQDAGATLLGKTNQDEFAMGSSNENSAFGPVLNPWDRTRVPGGSSGGSAAAVAGGSAPWAIGTDTGGSIRQPASLCGIVGLKPTYGACSRYGMIAFASSLDQAGPFTRDVTDAALLFAHMAGRDPHDSTSPACPRRSSRRPPRTCGGPAGRPRGPARRVGGERDRDRARGAGVVRGDAAARRGAGRERRAVRAAARAARAVGLLPDRPRRGVGQPRPLRRGALRPARRRRPVLETMYTRTRGEGFGAEVKRRIMLGTYALASGYYDAYYGTALKVRTKIAEDFRAAFAEVDFIVTPTSPTTAFELGAKVADPLAMYLNDYLAVPMSLAGLPAISIPSGLADGLPVGFQLAGPAFSEGRLLDAAHALEGAIGFDGGAARAGEAARGRIRGGDRAGDPRPAEDAHEDVLRV